MQPASREGSGGGVGVCVCARARMQRVHGWTLERGSSHRHRVVPREDLATIVNRQHSWYLKFEHFSPKGVSRQHTTTFTATDDSRDWKVIGWGVTGNKCLDCRAGKGAFIYFLHVLNACCVSGTWDINRNRDVLYVQGAFHPAAGRHVKKQLSYNC